MRARTESDQPDWGESFTEFVRQYYQPVLLFARHHAGFNYDVENVVAEAFAKACVKWATLTNPRAWIYRVVMNAIHDIREERMRITISDEPYLDSQTSAGWTSKAALPGPEWAIEVSAIRSALSELPAKQRAAVLLDYEGWTPKEIAAALECATVTVGVHLHLGRARLRKIMSESQPVRQQPSSSGMEGKKA